MLRMTYGPINGSGVWTARHSDEFYALYDELDVVKVIQVMK
jgi:hypothetical protein